MKLKMKSLLGFSVQTGLRAGRSVCYEEINGVWYPIVDPNNPVPSPTPPPVPGVQLLACKSCTGTESAPGNLVNASCEVCYLS